MKAIVRKLLLLLYLGSRCNGSVRVFLLLSRQTICKINEMLETFAAYISKFRIWTSDGNCSRDGSLAALSNYIVNKEYSPEQ